MNRRVNPSGKQEKPKNIRYVLKGKISIEEAAEDCGLTVEDFSKKKEEYCENRGISSK